MRRRRGESLSERLRSEVQVSSALWHIGPNAYKNAISGGAKAGGISAGGSTDVGFPCPREVKPLMFFYKYLQPIGAAEGVKADGDNSGSSTTTSSQRKLRVNLPLTVICERSSAHELVLWLRTDSQGNVVREDKTMLWRKKLHNDLIGVTPANSQESDPVLAVRTVARWKNTNRSYGGSAVVLTRRTLDPILAVPCELPICVQQFVHCRGSQASIYRIFWCDQERKCFAVNLTSSLKCTEAPEDSDNTEVAGVSTFGSTMGIPASTMAAVNAAYEAAMVTAAETARFYCVTASPDIQECARWPKLRGATIAEGVQATSRIVEHVQLQLPTIRFTAMTADYIKDTEGVWWLIRVVDFKASSSVEPSRDDAGFGVRDSAVLIPEELRTKTGRPNQELPADEDDSPRKEASQKRGEPVSNALNARICFLCGCSCELTPTFRGQLESILKDHDGDEIQSSSVSMVVSSVDQYRMTLTMALDTIFLMRQRGVALPVWENAVSTVRKSQLRDVCDFPVCVLCYRIYQQQNRLQLIARELHNALSPAALVTNDGPEVNNDDDASGIGMATSAVSGLGAPQLLSTELRYRYEAPKNVLEPIEVFRKEFIPPALLRGDSPEARPTWSTLAPVRGADVDPTATQLRLVFLFHELQDAGPALEPADFFLEYQLGQNVTQIQLEGSKLHTPNRWQLCEARVHYLCATLDGFSEFCANKRLLIKMKAKPRSLSDIEEDMAEDHETSGENGDGSPTRYQRGDKEELFGLTLLSMRSVMMAAKCFGNSLQPESRTDFLLELHTASFGMLTLKLTVGLLVDPVPLGHIRDVVRDGLFLEEDPPCGVYWPPLTYCLSGLAIPRDWVGALMPSEYTKVLPMRRKNHSLRPSSATHLQFNGAATTTKSSMLLTGTDLPTPNEIAVPQISMKRRMSNVSTTRTWMETRKSASTGFPDTLTEVLEVDNPQQIKLEPKAEFQHSMSAAMADATLSRACMAAKRIVFRITEDSATKDFPTILLAAILRHAGFASFHPTSSSSWKKAASFHFTRRYSIDRLLTEVKPGSLPVLGLLGELLFVLLEDRGGPVKMDVSTLETLLGPFWQQSSGWTAIPRTESSCLPERRVVWNRAIRRWEAANATAIESATISQRDELMEEPRTVEKPTKQNYGAALAMEIGDFRSKTLALVLCELFEQMEALDDSYIEIAELRSLAKCLREDNHSWDEHLDPEIGTRERLSGVDIAALAGLVDKQRRLAVRTLLRSLVESTVIMDELAHFDQVGQGEMSLEDFRELACEALILQRKMYHTFLEEPKKSQDGFCLRHGFVELYETDSVCVLCTSEYQAELVILPQNHPESLEKAVAGTSTVNGFANAVQVARDAAHTRFIGGRTLSMQNSEAALKQDLDAYTRREPSPSMLDRPHHFSPNKVGEEVPDGESNEAGYRRRRAISTRPTMARQKVDTDLDNMLDQLHAAERTIVNGEAQVSERKSSLGTARTRTSISSAAVESITIPESTVYSDRRRGASRKSVTGLASPPFCEHADVAYDNNSNPVKKKKLKRKIVQKPSGQVKPTTTLPTSASLSKLLRMEFTDRKRNLATSASETIIEKAVRVEERRKQLDRLVLAEVQEVKRRLAKLLDEE